jgi:hypothetical protein
MWKSLQLLTNIDNKEIKNVETYFSLFGAYFLRSEPQKGQNSFGLSSLFPQLGQKAGFSCWASDSGIGKGGVISVVGAVVFGFS